MRSRQITTRSTALLAGLLGNIGFKTEEDGEYIGARGIKFSIFPGSVLKKSKPKWVVAAELTETKALRAHRRKNRSALGREDCREAMQEALLRSALGEGFRPGFGF